MAAFTIDPQGQVLAWGANVGDVYASYDGTEGWNGDGDPAPVYVTPTYSDAVAATDAITALTTFYAPDGPVRLHITDAAGGMDLLDEVVTLHSGDGVRRFAPLPTLTQLAAKVNVAVAP